MPVAEWDCAAAVVELILRKIVEGLWEASLCLHRGELGRSMLRPYKQGANNSRQRCALSMLRGVPFVELSEGGGDERVAALAPSVEAALQRANALDALLPEEQRHTGAGGFVWSSTVEDDFAVAGQTVVLFFQGLGVHAESAGNSFRIGFEVHGMAEVDDNQFFAGVDFFLQFIHGDARNAQVAQKALAGDKLFRKVGGEGAEEKDKEPAAEGSEMLGDPVNLAAENKTEAEKRAAPEKRAQGVEEEETPGTHVEDACKGSGDGAQARKKFRQQERTSALLGKKALGAAHAGIRLERNLAEQLEDFNAFAAAQLIPDGIGRHRSEHYVEQGGEKIHPAGASESAGGEQKGHRGKRQSQLLDEYPSEQQNVSVMKEEFESAVHWGARVAISGYFVTKGAVCPQ